MIKEKIILISRGNKIPLTFRVIFSLILFLIYIALTGYLPKPPVILITFFLTPLLPLIWTLQDIIEINMNNKIIHEYIWILGNKRGKPKPFNDLQYIFINTTKMRQTMSSWGSRVHYNQYDEYLAYLKLNSGKKYLLTRSKNHESLVNKMKQISVKLNIPFKEMNQ